MASVYALPEAIVPSRAPKVRPKVCVNAHAHASATVSGIDAPGHIGPRTFYEFAPMSRK